jgi:hypothetical protein
MPVGATPEQHLLLLIEYRKGHPIKEPVHVKALGANQFRLLYSPGFVQGVAAGDTFRLLNDDGDFEVLSRAGNIAVQLFHTDPVEPIREALTRRVEPLGGVLDGGIERGLVFTLPLRAGFPAIETLFNRLVEEYPGLEWYYGNVYDRQDGVTPLNWWQQDSSA